MNKSEILESLKQMPNVERLEVIEFASRLIREEIERPLSLAEAAEIMRPYYEQRSELTQFTDLAQEDFYEYKDYA